MPLSEVLLRSFHCTHHAAESQILVYRWYYSYSLYFFSPNPCPQRLLISIMCSWRIIIVPNAGCHKTHYSRASFLYRTLCVNTQFYARYFYCFIHILYLHFSITGNPLRAQKCAKSAQKCLLTFFPTH
jgi:hypothetical protein